MNTPPLIGKKAQRLSNVTRAASAVRRTAELSGYVLYDCLDECGKRLALILLESRKRYQSHAATIRRWAGEDAKKTITPSRNRDYSVKEDETV